MERYQWFLEKSGVDFKQYQYDGVQWCFQRETQPLSILGAQEEKEAGKVPIYGGIIADEMGLGKTIMMIATFVVHFVPKTLIILPNVILDQWRNEILRTTGHHALIYHGTNKKKITLQQLNAATIVITTYHSIFTVSKRKKANPSQETTTPNSDSLLHDIEWDRIVFDEAHHMRNKTRIYFAAKLLRSKIRWLITGTPVQNKRKDLLRLYSILNIPQSFYNKYRAELLQNIVLKRSKKDVGIHLPNLNIDSLSVLWENNNERSLSLAVHDAIPFAEKFQKLRLLLKARQTCILSSLLKTDISPSILDDSIPNKHEFYSIALLGASKIHAVVQSVLSNKANGKGKLIFCHFRNEIDIIVQLLREGGISNICAFDGRMSQAERFLRITQVFEVIVLQIQTGCEGLNLQKNFSEIYFVSPHWNPAIEDQAIARCHRIGQTQQVHVFRFYMDNFIQPTFQDQHKHTLDKYILSVQQNKREISTDTFK